MFKILFRMKRNWESKEESELETLRTLIEKDVTRTDSLINRRNLCRVKLLNIVMTYCVYHPESGYAQGMTDMAAPILYIIGDEALTYACFCTLMRYMSPLFHSNGLAINRRLELLKRTIQAIDGELWTKIEQCDIGELDEEARIGFFLEFTVFCFRKSHVCLSLASIRL